MTKRRWKTILVGGLLVCFIILRNENFVSAVTIGEITSDSIEDMENKIDEAEQLKEQLETDLSNVQSMLKELEVSKNDLASYISQLDSQLEIINDNLEQLEALISEKEGQLEITRKSLSEALMVEEEQYEAMKSRVKFMYEKGDTLYFELLFDSSSFSDLLNKAEYISKLSEYDRNMLLEYQDTVYTVETMEAMYAAEKELLDEAKANVVEEQEAVSSLLNEKQVQIEEYEADISNKEAAIQEFLAEIEEQDAMIAQLETSVTEERKAIALAQGYTLEYDGSRFVWPAPSYTRISCDYGWRIHPILGIDQFHNGVDMAAPSGTSILAAYSGVVAAAGYSSTMGNYVMLDHGSGLMTIYMHASKLYVSENDLVMSGETIALIGSTGRSTGAHLHFGVRKDGVYQSPWNYLQ